MKNSLIIEYSADDKYQFITNIFSSTKYMSKALQISRKYCQSLITRKIKHKQHCYERVWFKNDEKLGGENE